MEASYTPLLQSHSLPALLPLTQRDNSSCELRNPVCRLPFETFSCQTIFFKNRPPVADYSTEFVKSRDGGHKTPPAHTQSTGFSRNTRTMGMHQQISATHKPSRGEYLILEATSFISAHSRRDDRQRPRGARSTHPTTPLPLPPPSFFLPPLHKNRHLLSHPLLPSPVSFFSSPIPTLSTNGKEY